MLERLQRFLYSNFFTAIDRFVYHQLFINYLIGLMFFSSIIMINELYYIIRYYFEQNVPLLHVFSMIGALIPFLISFSMPFGVLPAYLLFFGKLSQDSEITAMRACGFSHFRIMWPGALFGIFIMIFSYQFKNTVEAKSNGYFLQLKAKVLSQKPVIQLLDNVFLNIGDVQLSFQSAIRVPDGDDILSGVYAVDVKNKRTIRSEQARIFVNPDNPEHYIIRFLRGDMNQLTAPPIITPPATPGARNLLPGVLPQALSASNEAPQPGIVTNEAADGEANPAEDDGAVSNQDAAGTASNQAAQAVPADGAVSNQAAQPVPAIGQTEGKPEIPAPPGAPKEEFYISSFGSMTMNNYVFLPGGGYFRGPETMSYRELQNSIYADENNRAAIAQFEKAKRGKEEIGRLYFTARFAPFLLANRSEDEVDRSKTEGYLQNNLEELKLEKQNADLLYKATRSQLPNFNTMRLYEKLMLPVSAFVFALLALPLGLFGARSGRGEGLSISLVVTLVFYGFKSAIENAVGKNVLPPSGIWIPAVVFGVVALVMYTQKVRE